MVCLLTGIVAPAQRTGASPPGRNAVATTYRNPILFADYSDPDVIRDGEDYWLVASSFHFVPGLPLLHSRDLVHWQLAGHALSRFTLGPAYDMHGDALDDVKNAGMRYGRGVWAPALRKHQGLFYIYFPTPEEGIFVITAPRMTGPWSEPVAVISAPHLEDPCPFWDDDGQAYLVHSRTGAGPLILHRLSADGLNVLDAGTVIVEDRKNLPTLEGPKFYKRHGWYYLFAPEGGVSTGAQAVLRSRNIYGPYEHRLVLAQGGTAVNGPHQGAYVETPDGHGWFVHFQQRGGHGRIVWLEPVRWTADDWPLMGDAALDPAFTAIIGEPVMTGPLPVAVHGPAAAWRPATSDQFSSRTLGLQWEWNHNPVDADWSLAARPGWLRLTPGYAADLMHARNTLTECLEDESVEFTTRLDVSHLRDGERAGLSLLDKSLTSISVVQEAGRQRLMADLGSAASGQLSQGPLLDTAQGRAGIVQLRVRLIVDRVSYSYSLDDGRSFRALGEPFTIAFSWWKGARPALFSYSTNPETGSSASILVDSQADSPVPSHHRPGEQGYAEFDWAHYRPLADEERTTESAP